MLVCNTFCSLGRSNITDVVKQLMLASYDKMSLEYLTSHHLKAKCNKNSMLREHKPPPIRRIWISDFGLPDPKRDPDRHQNCITWSMPYPSKKFVKIRSQVCEYSDGQTDKQTEPKTPSSAEVINYAEYLATYNSLKSII